MNKKKILFVDDEKSLCEFVELILKKESYEVGIAYNGVEGLEKVRAWKPDIIILDILMPEMDGYNMLKELRRIEEAKNIPVIIVTAKEKMEDLFKVEGIVDYIVKPFDKEALLAKILKALEACES